MLKEILTGGLATITGGVRDLVGTFKLPPEKQLEFEARLRDLERSETETIVKAAESVLVEEAKSQDGYVRRARPTFLYLMYATLFYNHVVRPLVGQQPLPLPEELLFLFGSGFLGYCGVRSWDKRQGKA